MVSFVITPGGRESQRGERGGRSCVCVASIALAALVIFHAHDLRAHGGGLDVYGCHNNRKTNEYHCHGAPTQPIPDDSQEAIIEYYKRSQDLSPTGYMANVIRVTDGDTVRVRAEIWLNQTVETNIRLRGIDTPEIRGAKCPEELDLGVTAKAELEAMVNEIVILRNIEHDKYGDRVVADIYDGEGRNLSEVLLDMGLAQRYSGSGARPGWCP